MLKKWFFSEKGFLSLYLDDHQVPQKKIKTLTSVGHFGIYYLVEPYGLRTNVLLTQ